MNTEGSTTTVGPGSVENQAPDQAALDAMNGNTAVAVRPTAAIDGTYRPPEVKFYAEYMKITYGVGFGVELGVPAGSLVLGKKDIIAKPKEQLVAVIVAGNGFWREWRKFEAGNPPKDFATEAEARKAGFITQQPPKGSGLPLRNVSPAIELAMFIRKPAPGTSSTAFTIMLDGEAYAPVRFTADRGVYLDIAKNLDNLVKMDAAFRGVAPKDGKLCGYFVTLSTLPQVEKDKTFVHLNLNPLLDAANKPVRVTEAALRDLKALNEAMQAAAAGDAPAPDGE